MDDVSVWIEVFPLLSERSRNASAPSRSSFLNPPWLSLLFQTA